MEVKQTARSYALVPPVTPKDGILMANAQMRECLLYFLRRPASRSLS